MHAVSMLLNNKYKNMKTKATPNKSILKYTQLVCLFLAFIVMGCSNDDEVSKSNEKEIISFTFLTADNASLTTLVETTIDEANKTITATLPINTASDGLIPSVIVSDNASYTPEGIQDFTSPVTYKYARLGFRKYHRYW